MSDLALSRLRAEVSAYRRELSRLERVEDAAINRATDSIALLGLTLRVAIAADAFVQSLDQVEIEGDV